MIRADDLRYRYASAGEQTLRGLTFEVEDGELFGFLGPSGAGKSTTQKVLTGLFDDYEGSVTAFGTELREWDREYYERIGVSPETPNLYSKLTGYENLELFASLYPGATRDPAELLDRVGLADVADRRVVEYSKGMAVRLTVVRALVHDPDLLFLDEPTAGLDPGYARTVEDLVREVNERGTTVFLTTHDMTVADRLCDRVAFIADGRLPVVDAPRRLKVRYGEPRVRVEYVADGTTRTREFPLSGLVDDAAFDALLRDHRVETIHTTEATLEDVFLEITGEELV